MKVVRIDTSYIRDCIEKSMYLSNFNTPDLIARQYTLQEPNKEALLELYMRYVRPINDSEIRVISPFLDKVNNILTPYKNLYAIPWKLVVFDAQKLENGFPHTHSDLIFLPDSMIRSSQTDEFLVTLIHEKIHVYQRLYPAETNHLILNINQFDVYTMRYKIDKPTQSMIRSNPDVNDIIYKVRHDKPILPLYKTTQPKNLVDINDKRDHPYEMMAYYLASQIYEGTLSSSPMSFQKWVATYL